MVTNVINNAGCRHTDIWLCTPGLIWFLCEQYEGYHPFEINPQLIVIEQADMMLTQSPFAETTLKIIRKYMDKAHPLFAQINKLRQVHIYCIYYTYLDRLELLHLPKDDPGKKCFIATRRMVS